MAHEGFNWKQQSLLACILFSSRVQRTPIISFLLYCLFSQLPPPRLLPSPPGVSSNGTILSLAPLFVSLPAPSGLRALRSSFEFRAFRLSYVPRTTSVSEFESFAEIHPDLTSPGRPSFVVARCFVALESQWSVFVHRLTRQGKERCVIRNCLTSTRKIEVKKSRVAPCAVSCEEYKCIYIEAVECREIRKGITRERERNQRSEHCVGKKGTSDLCARISLVLFILAEG